MAPSIVMPTNVVGGILNEDKTPSQVASTISAINPTIVPPAIDQLLNINVGGQAGQLLNTGADINQIGYNPAHGINTEGVLNNDTRTIGTALGAFAGGSPTGAAIGNVIGDTGSQPGTQELTGAGDILGAGGGNAQTIINEPWGPQQAYLKNLFSQADSVYNNAPNLYPDFSTMTQSGLNNMYLRGLTGSALEYGGQNALSNLMDFSNPYARGYDSTISGNYLNANPANQMAQGAIATSNAISGLGGQQYDAIANRVGNNPGQYAVMNAMGGNDPASWTIDQALNQRNAATPAAMNAMGMSGMNPASGYATNALSGQGPANQFLRNILGGQNQNPQSQYLSNALNTGGLRDTASENLMRQTAQGDYLTNNPYLDATFNQAADAITRNYRQNVLPSLGSLFSKGGAYGSSAHQEYVQNEAENVKNNLQQLATGIYGGNYANERNLQNQAQQALANTVGSGMGRELQAAGALGGDYQNFLNSQLGAAGQLNTNVGTQLQGSGLIGDLYNTNVANQFQGANLLNNIYQGDVGNRLNAAGQQSNIFNANRNAGFTGAGMLSDMYNTDTANLLNVAGARNALGQQNVANQFTGANLVGSNYNTERGLQMGALNDAANLYNTGANIRMGAAGMVPTYSGLDYQNLNAMTAAGGAYDALNQNRARSPWENLGLYQGAITGNYGGTQTQPSSGNPLLNAIGTGLIAGGASGNPYIGLAAGGVNWLQNRN